MTNNTLTYNTSEEHKHELCWYWILCIYCPEHYICFKNKNKNWFENSLLKQIYSGFISEFAHWLMLIKIYTT